MFRLTNGRRAPCLVYSSRLIPELRTIRMGPQVRGKLVRRIMMMVGLAGGKAPRSIPIE